MESVRYSGGQGLMTAVQTKSRAAAELLICRVWALHCEGFMVPLWYAKRHLHGRYVA